MKMYRTLQASVAVFCLIAGAAQAQTVIYDAAPASDTAMMSAPYNWTGAYIGAHVGLGVSDVDTSTTVPNFNTGNNINSNAATLAIGTGNNDESSGGFLGGLHIGYNYQVDRIVVGAEADIAFSDLDSLEQNAATFNGFSAVTTDRVDMDYMATVRARLGVTFDRALVYGTGGVAFTDATINRTLDWTFADACPPVGNGFVRCHRGGADFDTGYVLGGGVEYAFFDNLIGKLEYTYADFGSETFTTSNTGVPNQTLRHEVDLTVQTVKFGMSYKFY